jgi:sarcosine oxidase
MHSEHFELVVVGLGAVGSAAVFHAAKAGIRVLGIDQYRPPHTFGSTHAESRITRLAVGEGEQYLPFVERSHAIWKELEQAASEQLLFQPGGYIITPPTPTEDLRWGGFVGRTETVADQAGVAFERHTAAQARHRAPRLKLAGTEEIGFEPTGGIVRCEQAVATQLQLAEAAGATVWFDTKVVDVQPGGVGNSGANVVVETASGTVVGDAAVVATGPWFRELAPANDGAAVRITRQVVYWFDVDEPDDFSAEKWPFVIWPGETISEYSAVFPRTGGRQGLKLLGEQFHAETTPDTVDRHVSEAEALDFYERLVEPRVSGVKPDVLHAEVCLYTNTVDDHFLIDSHPETDRIWFASPCSGHGFKHSTAVGEALVHQVSGSASGLDLGSFRRKNTQ